LKSTDICPGVTPAQAAVATDAINTAYHAIHRRAEVKASETVFLFGLGGLGFNALQIVLAIGARVIVSDVRDELLQAARELGVPERDIVPPEISPEHFVTRESLQIDTVLEFVGKHQTFNDAQNIGTCGPTRVVKQTNLN
jgi:propanol-preferring alcohol dehydrogenase